MKLVVGTADVVVVPGGAVFIQNKGPGIITVGRESDIEADDGVTIASAASLALPASVGNRPLYLISSAADTDVRTL